MLRYRQQTRRDHVVSLLPPISVPSKQAMTVEERIFSDTPPPMTYTGSFPSKVLRHLDKSTFYSTPTKGEEALANKVMHEEEHRKNDNSHAEFESEKGNQSNHANHKPKILPHRKPNDYSYKGSIKTAHEELSISTERRCSSAPGLVKDDQSSNAHGPEAGNLTAPSTPLPTLIRRHINETSRDTKKVIANNSKAGTQHSKKDLELELRGDGLGLHGNGNGMQAEPNQHRQQQHYQQTHLQQQQPQQNHAQTQNLRSSIRDSSTSHSKHEKPKFEVRAVGFSLSPREKREDRNQHAVKSMDVTLRIDSDIKDPMLPGSERVNEITSEKSDITVRVPVIDNAENEGNGNEGNDNNTNEISSQQDPNIKEIHQSDANIKTPPTTTNQGNIPPEIAKTEQISKDDKKVTSKKEKKKSHTKGRRNSKQHTKKK